jgi:hypothetical protein
MRLVAFLVVVFCCEPINQTHSREIAWKAYLKGKEMKAAKEDLAKKVAVKK